MSDDSTIEINEDSLIIKDAGVTTAKTANNTVTWPRRRMPQAQ